MELNDILTIALKGGASDIHMKAGLPPMFRVDGTLVPLKDGPRLPPEEIARMCFSIMSNAQKEKFRRRAVAAYRVNRDRIAVIQTSRPFLPDRIVPAMREHLAIIDALERRDAEAAVAAIGLPYRKTLRRWGSLV
jgi:Tfp pilus assembly ATPase PilU